MTIRTRTRQGPARSFRERQQVEGLTALPKRADPSFVDEFVKQVLDSSDVKLRQLSRCGELMRFYDLATGPNRLSGGWTGREGPAALRGGPCPRWPFWVTFGDDAMQDQAAQYYQHLSSHRLADRCYGRLIDLFFHLPATADPKTISGPIEARVKSLEPRSSQTRMRRSCTMP